MEENLALKTCQECNAKCCKLGGAEMTKAEMQKITKAGYPENYFNKISKNHYEFKNINGACIFLLRNNACSIYNLRQHACKAWPVVYEKHGNKKREFFIANCPVTKYLSKQDLKEMKEQASKITEEISEYPIDKSKMPKDILDKCIKRYNKFKKTKI